ncbi:MAG: hypothetical protein CL424_17070 [Acidimicrobiaceae bacterium]|nr:hypothetical protein [Acidimicrobiaceae bacterium]
MKLSHDPLADDGLTFFGAAQLHARRFDRSIASSVFLLNASDRLVTDGEGGVLALTDLRRSKSRMAVLSATVVAGLAVVMFAAFFGLLLPGGLGVGALVVILVVVAPKRVRAVQAVRRHEVDGACWLVTDVATEPGRHIGDRLVGRASQLADEGSAFLILDVAAGNSSATRLYAQSGFMVVSQDKGRITMRRSPNRPSK